MYLLKSCMRKMRSYTMKIHGRKLVALLLAAAVLLNLTACGKRENAPNDKMEKNLFHPAPVYQTVEIAVPVDAGILWGSCTNGNTMYFCISSKSGEGNHITLCRTDFESGETVVLKGYQPTAASEENSSYTIEGGSLAPDGSLWCLERQVTFHYDLPEAFNKTLGEKSDYITGHEVFYILQQLDGGTGEVLKEMDISEVIQALGAESLNDWALDGKGNIYLCLSSCIAVLDNNGQKIFTLDAITPDRFADGSAGGTLVILPDGMVAALTIGADGKNRELHGIDPDARKWDHVVYPLSDGVRQIYAGSGDYLFYYMENESLFGWNSGENAGQKLISWGSAALNATSVSCFSLREDDTIIVLTQGYTSGDIYSGYVRLSRLLPSDVMEDGRTVLVYGTIGQGGYLTYRIDQFNESNDQYYIEIRDYAEGLYDKWNEEHDTVIQTAETRARVDIVAGQAPDILDGSLLSLQSLAALGGLEDLWPYIDNDPDLGRDALMDHVLECMEMNGRLYQVCSGFYLVSAIACANLVGERTNWTLDDALKIYDKMPDGSIIVNTYGADPAQETLLALLKSNDRFVDWSNGTCQFDSNEFISLLELCGRLRDYPSHQYTDDGGEALREGRQLFEPVTIGLPFGRYEDSAMLSALTRSEARCGGPGALMDYGSQVIGKYGLSGTHCWVFGDLAAMDRTGTIGTVKDVGYAKYVGFPTESSSGSYFVTEQPVAMSVTCKNKEGAWAFIRNLLLPGGNAIVENAFGDSYSYMPSLPINKCDFDTMITNAMEPEWCRDKKNKNDVDAGFLLDENGQKIELPVNMFQIGSPVTMTVLQMALTQEQYDLFMDLYGATDRVESSDNTIEMIVKEITGPFFAGDRSAAETAKLIQGRVQLYLGEQR